MKKHGKFLALVIAGMLFVAVRVGMDRDTCPPTPDCPCHAGETP
jgi:hypothetical protein